MTTYTAKMPDGKVATRRSHLPYLFCVAARVDGGEWYAARWSMSEQSARQYAKWLVNCPGTKPPYMENWEAEIVAVDKQTFTETDNER